MLRVGVVGAAGKMGIAVCHAVEADSELELAARIDPQGDSSSDVQALVDHNCDVAVDFTRPDAVLGNVTFAVEHGVHCVVGTTGVDVAALGEIAASGKANVFVAPNFSVGAVLSMKLAEQAARFFASCEIVELHHNQKLDAPSGTAWETARRVAAAWQTHGRPPGGEPASGEEEKLPGARGASVDGVRVHSVRLAGLVAHQEILLGADGQTLAIRHDSTDRSSFMPGVLLAVKRVGSLPGLTVGLEQILDL